MYVHGPSPESHYGWCLVAASVARPCCRHGFLSPPAPRLAARRPSVGGPLRHGPTDRYELAPRRRCWTRLLRLLLLSGCVGPLHRSAGRPVAAASPVSA